MRSIRPSHSRTPNCGMILAGGPRQLGVMEQTKAQLQVRLIPAAVQKQMREFDRTYTSPG